MRQILFATAAVAALSLPAMAQSGMQKGDLQRHTSQMQQSRQVQQPPAGNGMQARAQTSPSQLGNLKIKQIQQALNEKGFKAGRVDGRWGPETRAALENFQHKQNLRASGRPDHQTLAALGMSGSTSQPSTTGAGQPSPKGARSGSQSPSNDRSAK